MRQRQELLNHVVHLAGLIHNHAAVVITILRVLCHPVLQAFCIALNQGNRCLQLMRHIGNEFPLHRLRFVTAFDILLKLRIGIFQLGNGLLQGLRQIIQILPEDLDFVPIMSVIFCREIEPAHLARKLCHLNDRSGDSSGKEHGNQKAKDNHASSHKKNEAVCDHCIRADRIHCRTEKIIGAVGKHPPTFHILRACPLVQNNLDTGVVAILQPFHNVIIRSLTILLPELHLVLIKIIRKLIGILQNVVPHALEHGVHVCRHRADRFGLLVNDQNVDVVPV